jgi:hypothetical protein
LIVELDPYQMAQLVNPLTSEEIRSLAQDVPSEERATEDLLTPPSTEE